jgi:hypothetical protein
MCAWRRSCRSVSVSALSLAPPGVSAFTMNPLKLSAKPRGSSVLPCHRDPPRVPFEVNVGGRLVRGELNPKTLRRTLAAVIAGQCTVIVQGRLDGDMLVDAGSRPYRSGEKPPALPLPATGDDRRDRLSRVAFKTFRVIRHPAPSRRRSNWDEPPPDWCYARR